MYEWIVTNKGSAEAPRYRSRLVCMEVRHEGCVEPIFAATPPLETLRVLLGVACQEDVFRVEDPFLISTADVSRAHFYADAVRGRPRPSARRGTPWQRSQACVGNCERRCTDLWMLPTVKENIMLRFWEREDFPEAWLVRATSSIKACKPAFWCTVTLFLSGPT